MRYRCVKHWSAGLLSVLLAVVLAGCGGTADQGSVAAPGDPTGPGSLDDPAELAEAVGSGGVNVAVEHPLWPDCPDGGLLPPGKL